jgi:protein transport protein SEC23
VYELGYTECSKAYVFRGDKTPTYEQVQEQLGLKPRFQARRLSGVTQQQTQQKTPIGPLGRFLLPLSECEMTLTSILEEISFDPWPVKSSCRSSRCTGVALSIATSLLESAYVGFGARICMFIGGPCTMGDGAIVGLSLKETIRLHNDLRSGKADYFKKAVEHYQNVAKRLIKNGHVLDIFAANLDQVGVLEMRSCCENTGGDMLITDTFENPIFKETYKRYFKMEGDHLAMAFNATTEVKVTIIHSLNSNHLTDFKRNPNLGCNWTHHFIE